MCHRLALALLLLATSILLPACGKPSPSQDGNGDDARAWALARVIAIDEELYKTPDVPDGSNLPRMLKLMEEKVKLLREHEAVEAKLEMRVTPTKNSAGQLLDQEQAEQFGQTRLYLTGRLAIEQVIIDLKLAEGIPTDRDGQLTADGRLQYIHLIDVLRSNCRIEIEEVGRAQLVTIKYVDQNHPAAVMIVNRLMDNFISHVAERVTRVLMMRKDFFEKEVRRYKVRAAEAEAAALLVQKEFGGLDPTDPKSLDAKLRQLRQERDRSRAEYEALRAKHTRLVSWHETLPGTVKRRKMQPNSAIAAMTERMKQLDDALDIRVSVYQQRESHPAVSSLRRQIAALDREIAGLSSDVARAEFEEIPNDDKTEADTRIREMAEMLQMMQQNVGKCDAEIERHEQLDKKHDQLREKYLKMRREHDDARTQLAYWDDQLRQSSVALQLAVADGGLSLLILERAREPRWRTVEKQIEKLRRAFKP